MRTVGEILERKTTGSVVAVDRSDTVLDAVRRMDEANTGSVVVMDAGHVVGIFTERDLMRRVVLAGLDVGTTGVADVMTCDLIYTEPEEPVGAVMSKMTSHRCRHLPVVQGNQLLGVVSIGDLMKEITEEQSVEIRFLKEYITSG